MKIASTLALPQHDTEVLQPGEVMILAPDAISSCEHISAILAESKIDVLITDSMPSPDTIAGWRAARNRPPIILLAARDWQGTDYSPVVDKTSTPGIVVRFPHGQVSISQALAAAEAMYSREITAHDAISLINEPLKRTTKDVTVVGAGIVGLITALYLNNNEYNVTVFERTADPRQEVGWRALGCTHGGENARMFSLTECDNYHDRTFTSLESLHGHLRRHITDLGWIMGRREGYTTSDTEWASDFLSMPIWLADKYNSDIFEINHESYGLWRELQGTHPFLFQNVGLQNGLLRISAGEDYHQKQVKRQKSVGSYIRELSVDQVAADYPALEIGCKRGEISGGIEVEGFTLNIHAFVERLISHLSDKGVHFHWNVPVDDILLEDGVVSGLLIAGRVVRSSNYFLSTGAYGSALLSRTRSQNKIHGVLGAWITIPNLEPKLQRSLKISREGHIASSGNIILAKNRRGEDILIFGSGFGYLGGDTENIDEAQIEALFDSMEDYLKCLFPKAYEKGLSDGSLRRSRRYCIRPWTSSSLGIFEVNRAANGKFIIASGHNTGGFSQSTSIAKATLDALDGCLHMMHIAYHPRRFDEFISTRREWGAPVGSVP